MKKNLARVIRENAEKLPRIFEWEDGETTMKGWELNLSPLGDKRKFEPDAEYIIPVPQMRAVLHEQQMKDAYKKGGVDAVLGYMKKVHERAREIITHQ